MAQPLQSWSRSRQSSADCYGREKQLAELSGCVDRLTVAKVDLLPFSLLLFSSYTSSGARFVVILTS
jgi:hypothetical protein